MVWASVLFKIYFEKEGVFRLAKLHAESLCYDGFQQCDFFQPLQEWISPFVTEPSHQIFFKDLEGDLILISNRVDLHHAIGTLSGDEKDIASIYVKSSMKPEETEKEEVKKPAESRLQHPGVVCDGCDEAIYGTRFKCITCPDYDLCAGCEAQGIHQEHDFFAVRKPSNTYWRAAFAAYHKSLGKGAKIPGIPHHEAPTEQERQPLQRQNPEWRPWKADWGNDPVVAMDLNLNQPLENLLRDVNTQVKRVLQGFMPADITANESREAPQQPMQSTEEEKQHVERSVVVDQMNVVQESVIVNDDKLENHVVESSQEHVLEESAVEQLKDRIHQVERMYPVLVTAAEEAQQIGVAEPRKAVDANVGTSSGESEDGDWAFVAAETAEVIAEEPKKRIDPAEIENALQIMIDMGFPNEGNFLRALLENVNGDIEKVLDSL